MSEVEQNTELEDNISIKEKGFSFFKKKNPKKNKKQKKESSIIYPDLILYGYQEGTSLSDLKVYLKSKAEEAGGGDNSFYTIIKTKEGFFWEVHDSGSGKGTLKSVLKSLESNKNIIVKTSRRWVRVSKKKHGAGISSFLLNDDEEHTATEGILFAENMKSLSSKGNGLLYFGIVIALLGVISLFGSVIFKYSILDKYEDSKLKSVIADLPYTQKTAIKEILNKSDGSYLKSLVYVKSNNISIKGTYKLNIEKENIHPINMESDSVDKQTEDTEDKIAELEAMMKSDKHLVGDK